MLRYGLAITVSRELPAAVGRFGVLGGADWSTRAVLVGFAVIAPFAVVCWVWMLVLAAVLLRAGRERA